ncbi:hypothetical protein [Microbacterium sp. CIAB417]|uniref:hypothetical protein n=1 Tax=Microbacterium sp. CIAB417 TaxID=2860287 RepID=UPI001FAD4723|nr:hypothetical protein [Microbacterium sp. CIAB417]
MTVLDDDALTRLLIEANPARTPQGAEPDAAALRMRERIISGAVKPERAVTRRPVRVAWASAAAAAVAAGVVVFGLVTPAGQAVAVTPQPLTFTDAGSTQQIIERSRALLAEGTGPDLPQREVESAIWALSVDVDEQQMAVTPQISTLTWNEDLSGSLLIVGAEPYWPDGAPDDSAEIVRGEEVLVDLEMAPGEFNTPVVAPPGDDETGVRDMLTAYGMPEDPNASELVGAMVTALDQWTLTDAQHAAMLEMLRDEDGVRGLGASTDRLGRPVYALNVPDSGDGTEETVLISTETGRIVGVESEQGAKDGIIPEGAVVMYNLWF